MYLGHGMEAKGAISRYPFSLLFGRYVDQLTVPFRKGGDVLGCIRCQSVAWIDKAVASDVVTL